MQLTISQVLLRQQREPSKHILRMLGMLTAKDSRQVESSGYFRTIRQRRQLSKERTNLQTKNLFDCVKLQFFYAEILKIGEFCQTRPSRNSDEMIRIPCGEADRPTSVEGGQLLRRTSPGSKIGLIKEKIFSTKKEAQA